MWIDFLGLIKDILRQYWANILATAVFVCAALRYWRLGNWLDPDRFGLMAIALAGLVIVFGRGEWTGWTSDGWGEQITSDRNWLQQRRYTFRSLAFPIIGAIALVLATIQLYRL